MSDFTISLEGSADGDAVREAFETVVRSLAEAIDVTGELVLDGVTYAAADVSEEAAPDTSEEEETEEAPAEGETPEEPVAPA